MDCEENSYDSLVVYGFSKFQELFVRFHLCVEEFRRKLLRLNVISVNSLHDTRVLIVYELAYWDFFGDPILCVISFKISRRVLKKTVMTQ